MPPAAFGLAARFILRECSQRRPDRKNRHSGACFRLARDVDGLARDGSLTKDVYLGLVEKLFNAADTGKEGTLSAKDPTQRRGARSCA